MISKLLERAVQDITPKGEPGISVRLDWREYFKNFCDVHGRPFLFRGRLLFQDGWQYSATEYRGPEWPPPKDDRELKSLVVAYWKLRLNAVRRDLVRIEDLHGDLIQLKQSRSATLPQVETYQDPETGNVITTRKALDLTNLEARLSWLRKDLVECYDRLGALEDKVHGDDERPPAGPGSQQGPRVRAGKRTPRPHPPTPSQ